MTPERLEMFLDAAAIGLAGILMFLTVPLLRKKLVTAGLFLFALMSLMLAHGYWLAYGLMRPGVRMPFAANEIGEIAVFLLISAVLETVFREKRVSARAEMLCAGLFGAASVALWIAWSGEWLEDILGGLAFGYFLCNCARALKQSGALKKAEWILLGSLCAVLMLGQAGSFALPAFWKTVTEYVLYLVMFTVLGFLLSKAGYRAARGADPKGILALSASVYAFGLSTMYMSAGWFYPAAMIVSLASLPLLRLAVKREVTA